MYKPAKIREFLTAATLYKAKSTIINGRTSTTYEKAENPNLRGKFKLKGTSEVNQNGLTIVNDRTTFVTWYRPDIKSIDILEIRGTRFKILGSVENTELRDRFLVLNLEVYTGGA